MTKPTKAKGLSVPHFATEDEEAQFWDTHSPLEFESEPETEVVVAARAKDRPITIRLDSLSRSKLEQMAREHGVGPSSFARLILVAAIERGQKLPDRAQPCETGEGRRLAPRKLKAARPMAS